MKSILRTWRAILVVMALMLGATGALVAQDVVTAEPAEAATGWCGMPAWACPPQLVITSTGHVYIYYSWNNGQPVYVGCLCNPPPSVCDYIWRPGC